MTYKLAILKNETETDHLGWVDACRKNNNLVDFKIIDLTRDDWLKNVTADKFDMYLTRPPGAVGYFKQLYDERIYVLSRILAKNIYPSYEEILIYENKRMLTYWLMAEGIPHPRTRIFYDKTEAGNFAKNCSLPLVAKTAIGGGGSGIKIIKSKQILLEYINSAFSHKGIVRRGGPNLRKGDLLKRLFKRLGNIPGSFQYFKKKYETAKIDPQRWFVIFQEYIKTDFEWRAVRIGDSYFAHKKLKTWGEMFSGTSEVSWDGPSEELLDFLKNVTDKRKFLCQAVDMFEPEPGKFLVNEMQCFWGSKNPHQMIIDGKPGRYTRKNGGWSFEGGHFNANNSYDLRLGHIIELLKRNA
jgi:hypothetical protein